MKRYSSIKNGKKGGRKVYNSVSKVYKLSGFNFVILTENQYETLLERYGQKLLIKAIELLNSWLKSNPKKSSSGKNNYAYFRSDGWVINSAKELLS